MWVRIGIWTLTGVLVVGFWWVYLLATMENLHGVMLVLVCVSCPIALARAHPMTVYFVIFANAVTYALAGTMVEVTRRYFRPGRPISGTLISN